MSKPTITKDLIVLTPDRNTKAALTGLFSRPDSLSVRPFLFDVFHHPQHDPGCYNNGVNFLTPFLTSYRHALLIFDFEGSGAETRSVDSIESELEQKMGHTGWDHRAAVIVINPELEAWIWSDSPHVPNELGWNDEDITLQDWLQSNGFLKPNQLKPDRPKEAMESVLRYNRKPRSSSIYSSLAQKISLRRCTDASFNKLKTVVQEWFPLNTSIK